MTLDISALKKRRGKTLGMYEKKLQEMQQTNSSFESDSRFWTPSSKEGRGSAVIRFLPASPQDLERDSGMLPWILQYYRNFKNPLTNKFYNELDLSTVGQPDPVHKHTSSLWKGSEADKAIARERKRKTRYISNIIVVKDDSAPEKEGKVFLYSYGQKIYDKLLSVMTPDEDMKGVVEQFDPTDFWEGANFFLKFEMVDGYRSYDKSQFLKRSPLFSSDEDEEIEKLWQSQYSLLELNDPKNFKSYEELEKKYFEVIDGSSSSANVEQLSTKKTSKKEQALDVLSKAKEADVESLSKLASVVASEADDDEDDEDFDSSVSLLSDSDSDDEILSRLLK